MVMNLNRTYIPKIADLTRNFVVIDAKDKILGKVATKAATLLRGKHKPVFTPNMDTGDSVIIINAEKIKVTGNKLKQKEYQRYSGYPSGQKTLTLEQLLQKAPTKVLELAIKRMLPQNRLGSQLLRRVRIYAGDQHPHQAQMPKTVN